MKISNNHYYIVRWPETQDFMDDRSRTHLAVQNGYDKFGDSAYFVQSSYYKEVYGYLPSDPHDGFVIVHFSLDQRIPNKSEIEKYPVAEWGSVDKHINRSYFVAISKLNMLKVQYPVSPFEL